MTRTRDHHFRRLDNRQRIVPASKLERPYWVSGNDGGQRLNADADSNLREQPIDPHLIGKSVQAVPRAQAIQ